MTEAHDNDSSGLAPSDDLDDAVAARLARLAARRSPSTPPSSAAASTTTAKPASGPAYASTTVGPAKAKRRHAAAGARHAALVLSLATTGGLSFAMSMASTSPSTVIQTAGIVPTDPVPTVDTTTATDTVTTDTTTTAAATTSDPIVVNGDTFSNKFGNVQVQASFAADGTITSITTLQTPDGDSKSVRINDQAVPTLNAEALSIQSADVDTVSGATYTSNDYRSSLQSAIDTARASGLVATR